MTDLKEIKPEYPDIRQKEQQRSENVIGMFKTVTVIPTLTPKNWFDQIVYYNNSGTKRLYFYDVSNHTWSYTNLT